MLHCWDWFSILFYMFSSPWRNKHWTTSIAFHREKESYIIIFLHLGYFNSWRSHFFHYSTTFLRPFLLQLSENHRAKGRPFNCKKLGDWWRKGKPCGDSVDGRNSATVDMANIHKYPSYLQGLMHQQFQLPAKTIEHQQKILGLNCVVSVFFSTGSWTGSAKQNAKTQIIDDIKMMDHWFIMIPYWFHKNCWNANLHKTYACRTPPR